MTNQLRKIRRVALASKYSVFISGELFEVLLTICDRTFALPAIRILPRITVDPLSLARRFIETLDSWDVIKDFTCLLIDDDADDQEIFLSVLEELGPSIHCVTADNGEEAIRKLTNREVTPDLIFVDMNMPLMNGKQFLKEYILLDGIKSIPVIILTTSSDKKSMEETIRLGARDYITKPDKLSMWGILIREKINAFRTGA